MDYPKRVIGAGEKTRKIVAAVQARLNELGCGPITADGVFGPKTTQAVKLFQSLHRDQHGNPLEIDGKIGAITWAALFGTENVPAQEDAASPILAKAVEIAASQVGVMEKPEGSNSGPEVDQYLASVGLGPGQYWCAAFLYWCFQNAAAALKRPNPLVKTAGCLDHWKRTKGKRITPEQATANPALVKPGHIFILNTGGGHGHTGLIEKVDGGFLHTLEGNSNPAGSSNGIGVFRLVRKIAKINQGFIEYK